MSPGASASVTAVIAAAGSGERLGAGGPKAFVPLAGRPMVEWSIEALVDAGAEAIVVAVPPGHGYVPPGPGAAPAAGSEAAGSGVEDVRVEVVAGGETRSESVRNALEGVDTDLVAIHDAARPLVTPELAREVVATLVADPEAAGAIAAAPVSDTIKRAAPPPSAAPRATPRSSGRFDPLEGSNRPLDVEETLDRSVLWAAQTPQIFRVGALREALAGDKAGVEATDEAMLVEAAGGRVLICPAPPENLKVTTPVDLRIAAELLDARGPAPSSP